MHFEAGGQPVTRHSLPAVTSTMDYAAHLADEGCSPWTLVTAEKQTRGRGTHGRDWYSVSNKGLYLSLVIPPPPEIDRIDSLTVMTADILIATLQSFLDISCTVKPPNDVLVNGRKIAGILFESVSRDNAISRLILGLGLNLRQTREDLVNAGLPDATSLIIETSETPDIDDILYVFLDKFIRLYSDMTGGKRVL